MTSQDDKLIDAVDLLKDIVQLSVEQWVSSHLFLRLLEKYPLSSTAQKIILLGGIRDIFRNMPDKVFADLNARNRLIAAVQETYDALVAQEEAEQQQKQS